MPGQTEIRRENLQRDVGVTARLEGRDLGSGVADVQSAVSKLHLPASIRVEYGGKLIAYSGDTEWTDSLPDVARGADLFVCECNYFDKQVPGHLDYRTLATHRHQLECERLVLTHMSEDMLTRAGQLDVDTAADGLVIEL